MDNLRPCTALGQVGDSRYEPAGRKPFEETLPHTLAWVAWATLVLALAGAAWLVTPGRLGRSSLVGYGLQARGGAEREEVVREVLDILQSRVRLLHFGLRVSLSLTLLALALVVLSYAVDKVFLAP